MPSSLHYSTNDVHLPTLRDLVAPLFRYRRMLLVTFLALSAGVMAAAILATPTYEARMKILVKRERLDAIVTPKENVPSLMRDDVSESELYSEVELLTSRDLLEEVVVASGLLSASTTPAGSRSEGTRAQRLDRAVQGLRGDLDVQLIRKTTLIDVTYRSRDPQLAAAVLEQLASRYLAKHLAVHRPAGAHQFFSEQAARLQAELRIAETKLNDFTLREHVVSAAAEKDSTLQKLSEFEASLEQTNAAVADATRRLTAIDAEIAATPARQVTQIRDGGNLDVVRNLRNQILQLDIRRTDLLQKFTPRYPPVIDIETQLRQLRAALEAAEQAPLTDETTDQNPTYQWLKNEAARVRTERDALQARASAIRHTVNTYRDRARRLDAQSLRQQELLREVKAAEEAYLLYQRKQEEAKISDELDRTRIANVALAEAPSVPQSSTSKRRVILAGGGTLALLLSLALVYGLHAVNPYFRTPDEVFQVLEVPVLASLPAAAARRE